MLKPIQLSISASSMLAWKIHASSRIKYCLGTTATQKNSEVVFTLSLDCTCDWGAQSGLGMTPAPRPVDDGKPSPRIRLGGSEGRLPP